MKVVHELTKADIKFRRFGLRALYKKNPNFFPALGKPFKLQTGCEKIETNITVSTSRMGKGLEPWFDKHPALAPEDLIVFESTQSGVYKLSVG